MIETLVTHSKLAANPKQAPEFSTKISTSAWGELELADPKILRSLIVLMDFHAVMGGAAAHFGGPSALSEIASALFARIYAEAGKNKQNWFDLFNFVNDAGHCENVFYALKAVYKTAGVDYEELKTFRKFPSRLTGHGEAHCFPEGVFLSNGPLGSAFPQSQGLAIGDQLAGKNRTTITILSDGASMEGEAKEALAAIPGLAAKGKLAPYVLIISDNNTKLSGRIDKDCFSLQPTFASLSTLGWDVIQLENGHDLKKCFETFDQAITKARSNPKKPVCIHARTIKGFGTLKTAESSSGAHGFPLKKAAELLPFLQEIFAGEKVPEFFVQWTEEIARAEKSLQTPESLRSPDWGVEEKIQKGISQALNRKREAGLPIVSVTSDLPGSTGLAEFHKKFPDAAIDVGVAESNMISTAVGLSKLGFIPVVDTFAQFGVTKGALPLLMGSLSQAPVIAVFSHTGFQDAADGASHQALMYQAMTTAIPQSEVYCLTCSAEADALMTQAVEKFVSLRRQGKTPPHFIFFLGRENFPQYYKKDATYTLGKPQIVRQAENSKVAIIGVGSMLLEAEKAAILLQKKGIAASVVNPAIVSEVDLEFYKNLLAKNENRIAIIDDHRERGGFAQVLAAELSFNDIPAKVRNFSVKADFGRSAYSSLDLYKEYHLDGESVAKSLSSWFQK